jgi:hypothetical protein
MLEVKGRNCNDNMHELAPGGLGLNLLNVIVLLLAGTL